MKYFLGLVLVVSLTFSSFAQNDRPAQPDLPGDFVFDLGYNLMFDGGVVGIKALKSRSFGAYYMYTYKLNNYITFNPMLGVKVDKFNFQDDYNFVQQADRTFDFQQIQDVDLRKNQLNNVYLELPLEARFFPFKTLEGEGAFIGVGGMVGYRIKSYTKNKYSFGGNRRIDKSVGQFGMNDLQYGLQGRLGFKGVNVFYKYYLSDMFQNGPLGTNPTIQTIGINITGF